MINDELAWPAQWQAWRNQERGLPLRSTDLGGVHDDQYGYDASGNITSILDLLPPNVSNRSITDDGLDRLTTATAPNM